MKSALAWQFLIVYSLEDLGRKPSSQPWTKLLIIPLRARTSVTLYGLYNAFLYINFGAKACCPLSEMFYPRSSLLWIQISTQCHIPWPPLWADLYTAVYSFFLFFSQSSHHSPKWSGLLLCFLAGYLSPHTRMSALHGPGPVLLMLPLWGQKTVPGTLKTLSIFFCYIGGGINNFLWVLWSCKVVFIFVFELR